MRYLALFLLVPLLFLMPSCNSKPEKITITSSKDAPGAPGLTETLYRMCCPLGPKIGNIQPAYVTPVEVTKSIAQARREWQFQQEQLQAKLKLDREQEYFDDMHAVGLPLLIGGLLLMLAGLLLTVTRLKEFFVYGPEIVVLGSLSTAFGVTMLRYPLQIAWTCAGAAVVVVVNALIRARQNALAVKTTTEVVKGVEDAKGSLSDRARNILKNAFNVHQSKSARDRVKAIRAKL